MGGDGAIDCPEIAYVMLGHVTKPCGWSTTELCGQRIYTYVAQSKGGRVEYASVDSLGNMTQKAAALVHAIQLELVHPTTRSVDASTVLGFNVDSGYRSRTIKLATSTKFANIDHILPRSPITGEHHVHLLPSEITSVWPVKRRWLLNLTLHSVTKLRGATQQTLASILTFVLLQTDPFVVDWLIAISRLSTIEAYAKYCKSVTIRAKQLQHTSEFDFSKLFETEVLLNRGVGRLDWEQELANRKEGRYVKLKGGSVYAIVTQALREARIEKRCELKSQTWNEWWETRWLHVPGGSVHPRLARLEANRKLLRKEAGLSKKLLLCAEKRVDLEELLSLDPKIIAYPSEKYEWGKRRAIFGTDLEGFMLCDLAFPDFEQLLPKLVVTGKEAEESRVRRLIDNNMKGMMPFCFDFEDFNSQHSAQSMKEVIAAMIEVYQDCMTEDQLRAAYWTMRSLNRTEIVKNTMLGCAGGTVDGTLMSGWRLTTVINSLLNFAYLKASMSIDCMTVTMHSGDDVLSGCASLRSVYQFLARAEAMGIRAQPAKCATSSIAEFLRVDHKATNPSASQYISRACSTYVHSRPESREAMSLQMWISATKTRGDELVARGANKSLVSKLNEIQNRRAAEVYHTDFDLVDKIYCAHPIEGGFSQTSIIKGIRYESKAFGSEVKSTLVEAARPGIVDIANWIQRKLNMKYTPVRAVREVTERAVVRRRRKVLAIEYPVEPIVHLRALRYGAFKDELRRSHVPMYKGLSNKLALLAARDIKGPLKEILIASETPLEDLMLMA